MRTARVLGSSASRTSNDTLTTDVSCRLEKLPANWIWLGQNATRGSWISGGNNWGNFSGRSAANQPLICSSVKTAHPGCRAVRFVVERQDVTFQRCARFLLGGGWERDRVRVEIRHASHGGSQADQCDADQCEADQGGQGQVSPSCAHAGFHLGTLLREKQSFEKTDRSHGIFNWRIAAGHTFSCRIAARPRFPQPDPRGSTDRPDRSDAGY